MYPQPPTGWARSGWVSSQLIPDQTAHASALQYLGGIGSPNSQPKVSGVPAMNSNALASAPNSVQGGTAPPTWSPPSWLNQLLFGTGAPEQTAVPKPKGPALTQQASIAPITPQIAGAPAINRKRGLFKTILDLSPGSPTGFMSGGTFGGLF